MCEIIDAFFAVGVEEVDRALSKFACTFDRIAPQESAMRPCSCLFEETLELHSVDCVLIPCIDTVHDTSV